MSYEKLLKTIYEIIDSLVKYLFLSTAGTIDSPTLSIEVDFNALTRALRKTFSM